MANRWFAMAALHVSRDHWFAMRHVRYDAVWDSIFSRPLSGCIEMESTRVHSTLRRDSVRSLRVCDTRNARAALADLFLHGNGEDISTHRTHLGARAKLDLSADALAQSLAGYSIAA